MVEDKIKKQEERLQKQKERQELKQKKKETAELKNRERRNKKRNLDDISEESSDEELAIPFMETDDEDVDVETCAECKMGHGPASAWVGCDQCPRFYHIACCGDEALADMDTNAIETYELFCKFC